MFEDSLLESAGNLRSQPRSHATLLSFTLQGILFGAIVLLPLFYTDALPIRHMVAPLQVPLPATHRPNISDPVRVVATVREIRKQSFVAPVSIPRETLVVTEQEGLAPPAIPPGMDPFLSDSREANVISAVITPAAAPSLPQPAPVVPGKVRISEGVAVGFLKHEVKPVYPPLAVQTRTQGTVLLQAVISREGTVESLQAVSGPPLLLRAALDAVRQWRYQPFRLNGEAVEVETQIRVNFVLRQ
ncbi:MAG: TonB family protein [Candidatus Korobacteraceae bacterium]